MATTSKLFSPILPLLPPSRPSSYPRRPLTLVVRATSDPNPTSTTTNTDGDNNNNEENANTTPRPQPLNIRYRSRRAKQRQLEAERSKAALGFSASTTGPRNKEKKKRWEEMSLGEKASELYVGKKGLLFWLNKFAYASIFVVIGGWILFRFFGPALNLYQLEAPPLAPDAMFKSSGPN